MARAKKTFNFWADIAVHYTHEGKALVHGFSRRDADLAEVKRHCLHDVLQYYKFAGLTVQKFVITFDDGKQTETVTV